LSEQMGATSGARELGATGQPQNQHGGCAKAPQATMSVAK
jgi:hypothetical protein